MISLLNDALAFKNPFYFQDGFLFSSQGFWFSRQGQPTSEKCHYVQALSVENLKALKAPEIFAFECLFGKWNLILRIF